MKAQAVQAHRNGLELVCHIDPDVPQHVVGDSGRVRQIVLNLIGNAIKFTEHGEIVFHVRLVDQTPNSIRLAFSTRDTGIGIPADRQEAIFRLFEQVDMSTTRRFRGAGLGLAISSQLVQLMDGHIQVSSELGVGSTFEFTAVFGRSVNDEPPQLVSTRCHRVLLVEGNATTRQVIEEMLHNWGVQTDAPQSPDDAIKLIRESQTKRAPYNHVLIDASLNHGRGFEFAGEAHRILGRDGRILMLLTCDELPNSVARCERIGFASYLVKPIGQGELLNMLQGSVVSASASEDLPETLAQAPDPDRSLHILLVEDSVVNQTLAIGIVKRLGHEVVVAGNGQEAIRSWESGNFDLILMDVQMPEMDGLDATREVRAREKETGAHVPIIAVTAHVLPEDQEKCYAAGMDNYLTKPINAKSLAAVIESFRKKR